ncbi:MAG: FHA domain-containing protein [Deltaproteobacteria bacterium]|nr:FHA domain-containing protein [Deltaproteobacteria bacterium]
MASIENELTTTRTLAFNPQTMEEDSLHRAHLIVVEGNEAIKSAYIYSLKSSSILGRKISADIMIDDAKISRHHAQIFYMRGHYYIKDLNSTNGTYVNGKKISEVQLRSHDMIEIGQCRFEFNIPSVIPKKFLKTSFSWGLSNWVKYSFFASILTICFLLVCFSAKKSFHPKMRSPQSISMPKKISSQEGAKFQADLFYRLSSQAYAQGHYPEAEQHLRSAYHHGLAQPLFEKMQKAIEEASFLKQMYPLAQDTQEFQERIQTMMKEAELFVKQKEWDKAIITYQEVLMLDPSYEEAKKGILNTDDERSVPGYPTSKVKEPTSQTLKVYQEAQVWVEKGEALSREMKYAYAIQSYQKALMLLKRHGLSVDHLIDPLSQAIDSLKTKTEVYWQQVKTFYDAQKFLQAKLNVEKILEMNPYFKPGIEKHEELTRILDFQAKQLYAEAIVFEGMPDLEAAKQKWNQMVESLAPDHPYYKKAQQKLTQYIAD